MSLFTKALVAATSMALLSGCASTTVRQSASSLNPQVESTLPNAHMELAQPLSASATIQVYQVLGMKFTSGDAGKYGGLTGGLGHSLVYNDLNLFSLLFGSPASKSDAVNAAKYNAIMANADAPVDSMIETRVQANSAGFSLLGLLGYGTATAQVDGHGVILKKN
jgi:hypothetical protein